MNKKERNKEAHNYAMHAVVSALMPLAAIVAGFTFYIILILFLYC